MTFNEYDLPDLVDRSNDWFLELKRKKSILEKDYKYLTYKFKKLVILVNSIFFPKYTIGCSMYLVAQ